MVVNAPVHPGDLHPRTDSRLEGRAPYDRVNDRTVLAQMYANRVHVSHVAMARLVFGCLLIEKEFPSSVYDPAERRIRRCRIQPLVQKLRPIVRRNRIQPANNVLERVGLDFWTIVRPAIERVAEIVDALLPTRLLV